MCLHSLGMYVPTYLCRYLLTYLVLPEYCKSGSEELLGAPELNHAVAEIALLTMLRIVLIKKN